MAAAQDSRPQTAVAPVESNVPVLSVGWLATVTHEQALSGPGERLSILVADLERQEARSNEYTSAQGELEARLRDVAGAVAARNDKPGVEDGKSVRSKLKIFGRRAGHITARTCRVLLHYQQIFDVLNEQAPEYTTAVWGAVKLLSLVVCNNVELRKNLDDHLEYFIDRFQSLDVLTRYQPSAAAQKSATKAIENFLGFLEEAVRYLKEDRLKKILKSVVQPWKIRFGDLADKVDASIEAAQNLARNELHSGTDLLVRALNHRAVDIEAYMHTANVESRQDSAEIKTYLQELLVARAEGRKAGTNNEAGSTTENGVGKASSAAKSYAIEVMNKNGQSVFGTANTRYSIPITDIPIHRSGLYASFEHIFEGLSQLEACDKDFSPYHGRDARTDSVALRNLENSHKVANFISKPSSRVLWIYGNRELGHVDWMTKFALRLWSNVQQNDTMVCLHSFCGFVKRRLSGRHVPAARLAQSLLVQVIGQIVGVGHTRSSILSRNDCRVNHLDEQRLKESKNDVQALFRILYDIVALTKPRCLFIIIDGVHNLIAPDADKLKGGVEQPVHTFFEELMNLSNIDGCTVKIMMTSRMPQSPRRILSSQWPSTENFETIRISNHLHRPTPVIAVRMRKLRLSEEKADTPENLQRMRDRLNAGDLSFLDDDSDDAKKAEAIHVSEDLYIESSTDSMDEFFGDGEVLDFGSDEDALPLEMAERSSRKAEATAAIDDLDDDDPLREVLRTETGLARDRLVSNLDYSSDEERVQQMQGGLASDQEEIEGSTGSRAESRPVDEVAALREVTELLQASDEI